MVQIRHNGSAVGPVGLVGALFFSHRNKLNTMRWFNIAIEDGDISWWHLMVTSHSNLFNYRSRWVDAWKLSIFFRLDIILLIPPFFAGTHSFFGGVTIGAEILLTCGDILDLDRVDESRPSRGFSRKTCGRPVASKEQWSTNGGCSISTCWNMLKLVEGSVT